MALPVNTPPTLQALLGMAAEEPSHEHHRRVELVAFEGNLAAVTSAMNAALQDRVSKNCSIADFELEGPHFIPGGGYMYVGRFVAIYPCPVCEAERKAEQTDRQHQA